MAPVAATSIPQTTWQARYADARREGADRLADHVLDATVQCVEGGPDCGLADVFANARDSGQLLAAGRAQHGEGDQDGAIAPRRRQFDKVELESCLPAEQLLDGAQRGGRDRALDTALGRGSLGPADS